MPTSISKKVSDIMVNPEVFNLSEKEHRALLRDIDQNIRERTDNANKQIQLVLERYEGDELNAVLHFLGYIHGRISYQQDSTLNGDGDTNGCNR